MNPAHLSGCIVFSCLLGQYAGFYRPLMTILLPRMKAKLPVQESWVGHIFRLFFQTLVTHKKVRPVVQAKFSFISIL